MIFGSTMGVVGNAMHATAVDKSSLMMSVGGRFCMGFSAAEILQREIMAACIPAHVVSESARLLMSRIFGVASGLLIGAASAVPIAVERMGVGIAYSPHARQLQASSWVMMILWLIHLLRVLVQLRDQTNIPDSTRDSPVDTEEQATGGETERVTSRDSDSDASSSADIVTPSSVLYRSSSEITHVDPITTAFGGEHRSDNEIYFTDESTALRRDEDRVPIQNRPASRQWKTLGRILKLFSFHVGIPISLLVFFYVTFASEIFFTVTPLITDRYFGWSGARAGTFLGCLAILVLPNVFICEIVARRYEERSILKVRTEMLWDAMT